MKKIKQYVCDTNVFISAIFSPSSTPYKVVDTILDSDNFFIFSEETKDELIRVFRRDKFDKYVSLEKREIFIDKILHSSQNNTIYQKVDICRDPKDNKFLDAALASNAEFLITGDEDLLVLESIGQTAIITPRAFIEYIQEEQRG